MKSLITLVETDDSIYEYDTDCISCSDAHFLFIILICSFYALSEEIITELSSLTE